MVSDTLPDNELLEGEDEEAEAEVDKILSEVLKDRLPPETQKVDEETVPSVPAEQGEEEDEDQEEMLEQMRGRLEALKS
jgi:charged multivesicular body protein 3